MTAMLSSPMMSSLGSGRDLVAKANNRRYDAIQQPNSPTLKHDDLPNEFADQSFGSSMSLGSSFELSKLAASGAVIGGELKNADHPAFRAVRQSPKGKQHEGLGAAMGTILNSKSPGLAAKMNTSPSQYMDLSPMPAAIVKARTACATTPLKMSNIGEENLPPGSAMKEDTSNHAIETTLQRRHYSDFSGITQGGSLGRLFGTEISMHGNATLDGRSAARASLACVFGGHDLPVDTLTGFGGGDESLSSPDKEPPAKRRPASLPVSQNPFQRPSLRAAGMGPPQQITATTQSADVSSSTNSTSRPRPNLLKSMTTGHTNADEGRKRIDAKRASVEALRQNYRASDSIVPTIAGVRQARSRAGSTDRTGSSLFASMGEQRFGQKSSLPPPSHATIIESPSPTDRAERNGMADYFFDPQSPEVQKMPSNGDAQPSSRTTASASVLPPPPSIASIMTAGVSARPNTLSKAVSVAAVPLHTASSMLGKRANPYARKAGAALAASAAPEVQTTSGVEVSSRRLKVPAPRRCQSALDNSAAFQLAGASLLSGFGKNDDTSMNSIDASGSAAADCSLGPLEDASPSIMRAAGRQHATISASTMIRLPPGFDASGSPIAPSSRSTNRPGLFRRPSKDDSSPLGYGKRFASGKVTAASINTIEERATGSPYGGAATGQHLLPDVIGANDCVENHMPGFGASEREGKILPCFNVKDDGLMRITPETLRDMLSGKFDESMDGFQIVDCRFGYEFEGGHIPGAINLNTLDKVKRHFLLPVNAKVLPPRSQSGRADAHGQMRKKVIIFHCEFSVKRAPSSALALRQADRALAHDYPNCHYPEVYILQGGYCGFYKLFSDVCQPNAYVQMDDPKYVHRRSVELNGFRKQFSRHKSFAYGDNVGGRQTQSDGQLVTRTDHGRAAATSSSANTFHKEHRLPSALARAIKEEDDSASFDNSISSPSAAQADAVLARRRGLARHATSASVLGQGPSSNGMRTAVIGQQQERTTNVASPLPSANSLGFKPILNQRDDNKPEPTCIGDLSFGSSCSIADDTSFDVSVNAIAESPCAAINGGQGGRKTYSRLAPGPR